MQHSEVFKSGDCSAGQSSKDFENKTDLIEFALIFLWLLSLP